ncbi:hypothetical protein KSP40_PGU017204 [Platanthera guangdongensis]|uniref:DNA mismatch repair proteins mutS family domain-containing protein n=1 Tax=Platanthera guangdongensis TaxID=2320717 RepID=A0ABR2M2C7_9ASPA
MSLYNSFKQNGLVLCLKVVMKSTFCNCAYSSQIEMSELRGLLTGATRKSLVLVDEICRGTETAKGTCIAGSIVEKLDHIGCLGIVSSHLHGLFYLPLYTKNVVFKQMEIEVVDGRIRPTWKLSDGVCRESLAFETAQGEGIPEVIVRRAEELYLSMEMQSDSEAIFRKSQPGEKEFVYGFLELQKHVENALTLICQKTLIDIYKENGTSELSEQVCFKIGAREQPPPSTVSNSCVYVLFRPDKKLYVGQTDNLSGRVRSHRAKEGMQNAEFLYVVVPGKSVACQLETLLINQLPAHGFKLVNMADGKHRHFGMARLSQISNCFPQNQTDKANGGFPGNTQWPDLLLSRQIETGMSSSQPKQIFQ